jgi:hypothetical protein
MRRLVGVDADPTVGEQSVRGVLHPRNRYGLTRRVHRAVGTNEDLVPPHGEDGVGPDGDRGERLPHETLKVCASIEPRRRATNTSLTLRQSRPARRGSGPGVGSRSPARLAHSHRGAESTSVRIPRRRGDPALNRSSSRCSPSGCSSRSRRCPARPGYSGGRATLLRRCP